MKIVIAGGRNKAKFLIESLQKKSHHLIVIHPDQSYCDNLASDYQIPNIYGEPTKKYVLEDADIQGADVLIALTANDADNFIICQMAQKLFFVKKVVCVVTNPGNVEIFKNLGVHTVISATYMVAKLIEQSSTIENLIQSLSIEDGKVTINEITVTEQYPVVNQKISQIPFPKDMIISCVIRQTCLLIPNGETILKSGDTLIFVSIAKIQDEVFSIITGGKK